MHRIISHLTEEKRLILVKTKETENGRFVIKKHFSSGVNANFHLI